MEPRDRYDAISSFVRTSASVTPAKVMPPLTVSLICIGTLDGPVGLVKETASPLGIAEEFWSSKSNTSSLKICQLMKLQISTQPHINGNMKTTD